MGTRLGDYQQYHDPTFTLGDVPGRGGVLRDYVIPQPSAELGLWCEGVAQMVGAINDASSPDEVQAAVDALNRLPELETGLTLAQRVMGSAYDVMMADGVPHTAIQHCAGTVYAWIVGGERAAERYWMSGGRPEASGPGNRAQRRQANRNGTGGNRTAEADTTQPPASGSGTTSLPTPGRRSRGRRRGR
ncbi:DUF7426 family protein [Salinispora arenicola]|uniref:DUF7426 family protein n=1 Tax=Salinispora arenicola TaxID=168697 RepID=UPI00035C5034|nr:hypothetical protein [Salinispora arenicola]NIL56711.1 hypothetical protein [Salinispora arenicola]NIL64307.1 hypothetical protein [Salinispora arenicola]